MRCLRRKRTPARPAPPILLAELNAAGGLDRTRACVDGSHVRAARGGAATGPSPVDRRKTGSEHHLGCDGRGTPHHVVTTAADVDDITQTRNAVDGTPRVAGRPGLPRRRPESVLGDKAYDSRAVHRELRRCRIVPVVSREGVPNVKGLAEPRHVVERTFALPYQFHRPAVRRERRLGLHEAFVSSGCGLVCWRRLKKAGS
ncbi:transposase [Streptomyces sennicomposti]